MSSQLKDDGTLDTVICCTNCGEEMRYNISDRSTDLDGPAEEDYANFVMECIEDFDNGHTCREPETR